MKKQFMAFTLALVLCLGLAVPVSAAGFSDVTADHWASEQINRAVADGIVSGYADGSFRPAAPVSYAAFSLMLARAFYPGELAAHSDGGTEAGEAIMNRHNILSGTSRASRSGGADLPREDMAQCMYNLLKDKGAGIPSVSEQNPAMSAISDFYSISGNCRTGVLVCYTLGLLGGLGDGNFGPQKSMNRAQAAVVIGRLRDYVQDSGGTAGTVEIPNEAEPKAPPIAETAPEVKELPAFKLMDGENVQQMMNRINKTTPAYTAGYLANGKPITEANIQEILNSARETMPEDTRWDTDDFYNYRSPKLEYGGACLSFGCGLSDFIFGEDAPVTKHQNFDQLKVGDMVWIKNSATNYNHVVFITSFTLPTFYLESNVYDSHGLVRENSERYVTTCSGNSSKRVVWDNPKCIDDFSEPDGTSNTWVYSRY